MSEPKTHFEQIPVEVVKKIAAILPAKELPNDDATGDDTAEIETEGKVTAADERWREVAQKVQHEADPQKMIGLVQELIATFDNENKRLAHRQYPARQSGASAEQS
ncbi:MAG: hypothetical protein HY010_12535 [Acidobacteria bacterium]|nr:hypothetical protein [Acidobacteriota bacterium]